MRNSLRKQKRARWRWWIFPPPGAGQVDFYNVDVDDAPSLAAEYKVSSIPCLVLVKQGQFVDQSIGFKPEAQILNWIKSNL